MTAQPEPVDRRYSGRFGKLRATVDAMPDAYLECRSLGHAWTIIWWGRVSELPDDLVPRIVNEFRWRLVRVAQCTRCATIRDQFYPRVPSAYAEIAGFSPQYSRYRYPDGYQAPGYGFTGRAIFTMTYFERWAK